MRREDVSLQDVPREDGRREDVETDLSSMRPRPPTYKAAYGYGFVVRTQPCPPEDEATYGYGFVVRSQPRPAVDEVAYG